MSSDEPRTKYISINVLPEHRTKLDRLVKRSGTNRNAFLRRVIMSLSDSDVDRIMMG